MNHKPMLALAVLSGALTGLLPGCGAGTPRPAALDPERLAPARLYPMRDGYVWSYNVDTGTGMNTFAVSRVVRAEGDTYAITNGGEEIVYEVRADGIYRPQSGTYLLRAPIEVGATWPGSAGATARVASTTEEVDVQAGHFEGCVLIVEESAESGRVVRTTYCDGEGPVLVESTQALTMGEDRTLTVRGELIGLVRGEEDAEAPEEYDAPSE